MKSNPDAFSFNCPICNARLSADKSISGENQSCPKCNGEFQVPDKPEDEDPLPPKDLLEWLESLLLKMVIGIPKFIFVIIPKNLWRMFCDTFPWLVRFVRVSFLFSVWVIMTAWPMSGNSMLSPYIPEFLSTTAAMKYIAEHQKSYDFFSLCWVGLALAGSIWGLSYVVIRKRRAKRLLKSS